MNIVGTDGRPLDPHPRLALPGRVEVNIALAGVCPEGVAMVITVAGVAYPVSLPADAAQALGVGLIGLAANHGMARRMAAQGEGG